MGTKDYFLGVYRQGHEADPSLIVPRLMSGTIPPFHPYVLMVCIGTIVPFNPFLLVVCYGVNHFNRFRDTDQRRFVFFSRATVKDYKFLGQLSNYRLLKGGAGPWNYIFCCVGS
jgi:hypothetical protein